MKTICFAAMLCAVSAGATTLRVMKTGIGTGSVTSTPAGINCGTDCDESYPSPSGVVLTAVADGDSTFVGWRGDCSGTGTCSLTMSADHWVRAEFRLTTPLTPIASFTPADLGTYLTSHPEVNTPARFIAALPADFRQNWVLMSRSESLQTGTAESPRVLLPSANAQNVFTFGLVRHPSYPGADPSAIEFMQWDAAEKNFRFHEVVLNSIPPLGAFPARGRGVSADDARCSKCHSTRNVRNAGPAAGTTGFPAGTVKAKNKPNWDAYDSWAGMLPFNRDRIYQGSVEVAAFRKILNLWTWNGNDTARGIIEQLELQPNVIGVPPAHAITRTNGGPNDTHVDFVFDASPPVTTEPAIAGSGTRAITYQFDGAAGPMPGFTIQRQGTFITLHHSNIPGSDEGRGVRFFDALGGLAGTLNQKRIADEINNHRFATGSVPLDARPIALAITKGCVTAATPGVSAAALSFFTARNGMKSISDLVNDTSTRSKNLTRRKADIEKINLDRVNDAYLFPAPPPQNGLIQQHGAATTSSTTASLDVLRQEVFRREFEPLKGDPDQTVMGGVYVDREKYTENTEKMALFRYFLEPLGVSVDKWSMGVRGRSRTYTFADVFGTYVTTLTNDIQADLGTDPYPGLTTFDCPSIMAAVNNSFLSLPAATEIPRYTDVQRIFNKACIECHGGLDYPPFAVIFSASYLDLSEDETAAVNRLERSHARLGMGGLTAPTAAGSYLFQRITATPEDCPQNLVMSMMPCGGPPLTFADIETIRRYLDGGQPNSAGDPHLVTVDGTPYDFQAAGEFVLLRGENFEIQVRQGPVSTNAPLGPNGHTGLTTCVSLNTAVALRVGADRVTYEPNLNGRPDPEGLQLRVNGELRTVGGGGIALAGGGRIMTTAAAGGIQVVYPGGTDVVVTPGWWPDYKVWYLNIDVRHARATEGVMGSIAPNNWLPALPDGSFLGPRPVDLHERYGVLYGKFASAWRVTDKSSLFDYAPGTSTRSFTFPGWPGDMPRTCVLPPSMGAPAPLQPKSPEEAARICRDVVDKNRRANCEADVMVTGEAGFAKTYLATEAVQRNPLPDAPTLVFPADDRIDLAGFDFKWHKTSDRNNRRLTYYLCVWEAGTTLTFDKCKPLGKQFGPLVAGRYPMSGTPFTVLWVLFLAILAALLILYLRTRRRGGLLSLLALLFLIIALLLFLFAGSSTMTEPVPQLQAKKPYFWKIIAQDDNGGFIESNVRRFAVK